MSLNIPPSLLTQFKTGNVVLFLGAGASRNATHPDGHNIPTGQELADNIAETFLDDSYKGSPLQYVSELAISEFDLFTVQKLLYDIFTQYGPSEFHCKIPEFHWRSIYTTNYDFIVEEAYRKANDALQTLVPVIRNTPIEEIYVHEKTLPYFKLHGCLTEINDIDLPLILTPDQYNAHKKNRDKLFSKFLEDARNHPVLFVGYSMADLDIRDVLSRLDELKDGRPRSYLLAPHLRDADKRMWEGKKITSIAGSFKDFLETLDKEIDVNTRKLIKARPVTEMPIHSIFSVSPKQVTPSDKLQDWLKNEIDFIHSAMPTTVSDPKLFYKGYFTGWEPIINDYDVQRIDKDDILATVFLDEYYSSSENPFFFLIQGNAGSGKSVFLKRLAWEAGITFEKNCIFLKPNARINYDLVSELYSFVKARIFIFIDNAKERAFEILSILERTKREKLPVTIFATERTSVWNSECKHLSQYLTTSFDLTYLKKNEIVDLLSLLEKHNSLGYLENKTQEERIQEFSYDVGKELLVALYEATSGKPFEEIIFDEYNQINSQRAKSLYLTVSIFHRLGTYARAGLISRVHDIGLDEFREKLFMPLSRIVFDKMNYRINDYIYITRHREIANIIFEKVLVSQQSRFDEFARLLHHLDTDYQSDKIVFLALVNADSLLASFNDHQLVRNLYDLAEEVIPDDKKLIQQRAIYEMKANGGSLRLASEFIKKAIELCKDEFDPIIQHTAAEIEYKKAEQASLQQEADNHINKSLAICDRIIKDQKYKANSFPYHTKLKCWILRLNQTINERDSPSIERIIKEIEKTLTAAKLTFTNQEFILEAESKFNEVLDNAPAALNLLEQAYEINKASPYLALRLASMYYRKSDDLDKAISTVKTTLEKLSGDKDLNYYMAIYLSKKKSPDLTSILFHLRRSFTMGDSRYHAHYEYGKYLYLDGNYTESKKVFTELSQAKLEPNTKIETRDLIMINGEPAVFRGTIKKKEPYFGFVKKEIEGDEVFFFRDNSNITAWESIKYNDKVSFNLGFNYRGAVAIHLRKYM